MERRERNNAELLRSVISIFFPSCYEATLVALSDEQLLHLYEQVSNSQIESFEPQHTLQIDLVGLSDILTAIATYPDLAQHLTVLLQYPSWKEDVHILDFLADPPTELARLEQTIEEKNLT